MPRLRRGEHLGVLCVLVVTAALVGREFAQWSQTSLKALEEGAASRTECGLHLFVK
jgi:hypothetical protein